MSEGGCDDWNGSWWESLMYDVKEFSVARWWKQLWCSHVWQGQGISTYVSAFSVFTKYDTRKWYRQFFYCTKCGKSKLKEWTNF